MRWEWGSLSELLDALRAAAEDCDRAAINHGDSVRAVAHWQRCAGYLRQAAEDIRKSPTAAND